jgi:hypothetical protein
LVGLIRRLSSCDVSYLCTTWCGYKKMCKYQISICLLPLIYWSLCVCEMQKWTTGNTKERRKGILWVRSSVCVDFLTMQLTQKTKIIKWLWIQGAWRNYKISE